MKLTQKKLRIILLHTWLLPSKLSWLICDSLLVCLHFQPSDSTERPWTKGFCWHGGWPYLARAHNTRGFPFGNNRTEIRKKQGSGSPFLFFLFLGKSLAFGSKLLGNVLLSWLGDWARDMRVQLWEMRCLVFHFKALVFSQVIIL